MRQRILGLSATMLTLGLFAGAGRAQTPPVITQPDWLTRPNAESLTRHYPPLATRLGLDGYAIISCSVLADGTLTDCRATEDRPAGIGFGQAAIDMGGDFRMRPLTLAGKPIDGGTVRIPIRFVTPAADPPRDLPAPVSEEAGKQALRAVDATKIVDGALDSVLAAEAGQPPPGADRGVWRAAADAFRPALKAHREDLRAAYARAFASVYSEAEMSALADYATTAGDQAKASDAFAAVQRDVMRDYRRDLAARAHDTFCAKNGCLSPEDIQRVWRAGDPRDTSRIDIPEWARLPGAGVLDRARPRVAALVAIAGVARLTCRIDKTGAVGGCSVDDEAPAGLGFGAAALTVAPAYRLGPIQLSAGAAGRKVTVRVGFPGPDQPEPFHIKPGPDRAVALARKIADADRIAEKGRIQTELMLMDMATPPKGVNPATYEAALDAYRTANQQALADYLDLSVANMSVAYTEKQLEARSAFNETPAGKAQHDRANELGIAMTSALQSVMEKVRIEARTAFCAAQDCSVPKPPAQPSGVSPEGSTRKP